jgi:hypothetical protein
MLDTIAKWRVENSVSNPWEAKFLMNVIEEIINRLEFQNKKDKLIKTVAAQIAVEANLGERIFHDPNIESRQKFTWTGCG